MPVELKDVEVGSVVIDDRGSIGIVTDIVLSRPKYPITFAIKASGSLYKGNPANFKAVIGKVDIQAFKAASSKPTALSEPLFGFDPMFLPEPLKSLNLKPGDKINVRHGFGKVSEAVYEGYKPSRPKYPISYTIDGKRWKGPISAIVGKAA
jgi:hypothetical protein